MAVYEVPGVEEFTIAHCTECDGIFSLRMLSAEQTHELFTHHMDKLKKIEFAGRREDPSGRLRGDARKMPSIRENYGLSEASESLHLPGLGRGDVGSCPAGR